ncbi:MAG: DUF3857 domain-containing protein [Flavobacterium sp.]|nr:DUF3857 domain-containing protein [Flavobacterium sp.]
MRTKFILLFAITYLFISNCAFSQTKPITKLDKITLKDFKPNSPVVDSNAHAVVLANIGSSEFEGNNNGDFTLVFKCVNRTLLVNKNAFDEATVKVPIYIGNNSTEEERFEDFEATTYNVENGAIVETKLDKNAVFKEKYNRTRTIRKFTFANIKEGSIIEYKYTVKSPFYSRLRSWPFQNKYPVLWSQYHVIIPPMFTYYPVHQGFLKYSIDSVKGIFKNYNVIESRGTSSTEHYSLSGTARYNVWAIKDAPAFKTENFTSSSQNYLSKIDFQLHTIKWTENSPTQQILKGWIETITKVLEDEDYKSVLEYKNNWMEDDLNRLSKNVDDFEKAKKIYAFVRDNFNCTDHDATIWLSEPLKKIYQTKKGTVTDINLVLTAMLNNAGFDVHPVMLSTRNNGRVTEGAALLNQYNYVVARLKIDSTYYLLDASISKMGFGKLPEYCYNTSARLLDKLPVLIPMNTDNLTEQKITTVIIINEENGETNGTISTNLGYYQSLGLREKLNGKKTDEFLKEFAKTYPSEIKIENLVLDALADLDEPLKMTYDIKLNLNDEDIIYFNPLLSEAMKQNPFTSAERLYPVEMPYKPNEIFTLNMEIPKGYKVDELPKSTRVKLNENEGIFEYIISNDGARIQLRSKIVLEKANFIPEDYETLRNFYGFIVKKHTEQIVFKKIK